MTRRVGFKPNNIRICKMCKQDKRTKGGRYVGPSRAFVCEDCKPKLEKRNED